MTKAIFAATVVVLAATGNNLFAQAVSSPQDIATHTIQFVAIESDVKLEVLDWGGSGRPMV